MKEAPLIRTDEDGYPTDEFLEWVKSYDVVEGSGFWFIQEVLSEWWPDGEYGVRVQRKYRGERKVHVSTWGWSGNEELIAAMQGNMMFWVLHYYAHQVGGHYTFRFTEEMH
jgi:hypothetical protein